MRREDNKKKKLSPGSIIGLIVALAVLDTDLLAVVLTLAILIGPIVLIVWLARKNRNPYKKSTSNRPAAKQQIPLDDCPKPFCFHRDKGEHHVRRGKEIDPWDRPDIDISKYQRRQ